MPTSAETVLGFIATFIEAWPSGDAARLGSFFAEDAVYQNMPTGPVRGRAAIQAVFADFMSMGGHVAVDIAHLIADGSIVMTERVDHVVRDDTTVSLPMMGVIEVHDGVITAWRDYFDLTQFTSQVERRT
jgi:limonene-1,2-epoxide hydrolase